MTFYNNVTSNRILFSCQKAQYHRAQVCRYNNTFLTCSFDNSQAVLHRLYANEIKSCLFHAGKHLKFSDFQWDRYSANQGVTQGGGGGGEAGGLQPPTKS
jgi:hypothetical protein